MLEYLAEKGLNEEFCEELAGLTSDKEYSEYIRWLDIGRDFAK